MRGWECSWFYPRVMQPRHRPFGNAVLLPKPQTQTQLPTFPTEPVPQGFPNSQHFLFPTIIFSLDWYFFPYVGIFSPWVGNFSISVDFFPPWVDFFPPWVGIFSPWVGNFFILVDFFPHWLGFFPLWFFFFPLSWYFSLFFLFPAPLGCIYPPCCHFGFFWGGSLNPSVLLLWLQPLSGLVWKVPRPGLEGQDQNQPLEGTAAPGAVGLEKGGFEDLKIWGFLDTPPPVQELELSLVKDSEEPSLGNDP